MKNFIPVTEIIDLAKNELDSYTELGLIDNSLFIQPATLLNRKLGLMAKSITSEILDVHNYKACLPSNFHKLKLAFVCFKKTIYIPPSKTSIDLTEYKSEYKINECEMKFCKTEDGMYLNIIQTISTGQQFTYSGVMPIKINSKASQNFNCDTADCFDMMNTSSENEIAIKDDKIFTNFQTGSIYIEYYKTNIDSNDDILVLDDEIIVNAFKEMFKEKILGYIYFNTTDQSVYNKFQLQKQESEKAQFQAVNLCKTPEFRDLSKIRDWTVKRYNRIANLVYGNYKSKY
jgi:hypothetical protein